MKLLLDTHALLWWLLDDRRLSKSARSALEDRGNRIFVSAVSAWEVSVKAATGKLQLPPEAEDRVRSAIVGAGFHELAITLAHGFAVRSLPGVHADPFDRLLVAQCLTENLALVTNDRLLRRYPIDHLW